MNKFCPECGVKLEQDYKFCPECGYDLKKNISAKKDNKSKTFQNQSKNKKQPAAIEDNSKGISTVKSLGILGGIIAVILLILFLSGTFDTPVVKQTQQTSSQGMNQSSGVDLNAMNAIQSLESQVKANPGNDKLVLQLAHLKNDSGFPEQAIVNYKQYLEKNPKDADARVDMAVCYYVLKNYTTAISEMKTALKYKPDHQIAHLNLGIVNFAANNTSEGKEWLKKAVDLDPNSDVGKRAQELLNSH